MPVNWFQTATELDYTCNNCDEAQQHHTEVIMTHLGCCIV